MRIVYQTNEEEGERVMDDSYTYTALSYEYTIVIPVGKEKYLILRSLQIQRTRETQPAADR